MTRKATKLPYPGDVAATLEKRTAGSRAQRKDRGAQLPESSA